MKKTLYWINDYYYLLLGKLLMYIYQKPPKDYLNYVLKNKNPTLVIQGNANKWGFLKKLCDAISLIGYPVYIVPRLKSNLFDISTSAKIVRELIDEYDLKKITLVAHSKGGIIGKYILINFNKDNRISRLISIAAPFSGSSLANYFPYRSNVELSSKSRIIKKINSNSSVNSKIISIMPQFDNHVWSSQRSNLVGAKNIIVPTRGHHKIVFDKSVIKRIIDLIENKNK